MFSFSDKARRKFTEKVNQKMPAGHAPAHSVVRGTAKGGWNTSLTIMSAVFGLVFVVALSQGIVIFPGALFIVYAIRQIKPPRLIAVSSQALVAFDQGFLANGPKAVQGVSALTPFPPSVGGGQVQIGDDTISLDAKEWAQLSTLTSQPAPAIAQAVPASPYPTA